MYARCSRTLSKGMERGRWERKEGWWWTNPDDLIDGLPGRITSAVKALVPDPLPTKILVKCFAEFPGLCLLARFCEPVLDCPFCPVREMEKVGACLLE